MWKTFKLDEYPNRVISWEESANYMQNSLNHLDKLQSDTVQQLLNSEDKDMKNYARLFDLTRSDPGQVGDKYWSSDITPLLK